MRLANTLSILALALALVTVTAPAAFSALASPPTEATPTDEEDCTRHPPIAISGDEGPRGFVLANPEDEAPIYRPGSGVTAGTGTAEDPYVIEGWCIQAAGSASAGDTGRSVAEAGIQIEDTSAQVVVRDNALTPPAPQPPAGAELRPAETGILLREAEHVRVENNTVEGAQQQGLLLEATTDVAIVDNVVRDSHARAGIRLHEAQATEIRSNTIASNVAFDDVFFAQAGVLAYDASHNTIAENTIRDNREAGIVLSGASSGNLLVGNVLADNHGQAVRVGHEPFDASTDNTVADNEIRGDQGVFVAAASHGATVRANTIQATGHHRGIMVNADDATIEANHVEGSVVGIRVDGDGPRIASNELVANARAGVQLVWALDAEVANNTMTRGGLLLQGFDAEHFGHDIAASNTLDGRPIVHVDQAADRHLAPDAAQVIVTRSTNVTVADQTTRDAVVGVHAAHSTDVTVRDSRFTDNRWHGVKAAYGSGLSLDNVTVDASGSDGIRVRRTDNVSVADSLVQASDRFGVYLYDAPNSSVEATTIEGSRYEGLRTWLSPSPRINETVATDNGRIGIRVSGGDGALLANNTANDNGWRGIVVSGSADAVVEHSEVLRNGDEGIRLGSTTNATLRANNLEANGVGVGQWNSAPVDARENWWGCPGGPDDPACDDAYDGVNYEPWLTSPNAEAGAG